jgi:glycosyltransferase involved in cell wall biosynthesis
MSEQRKRRVLVVAHCFPPHAAIGTMRTLRVVRQLHADGWQVTVLTAAPSSYLAGTPVDDALLERIPAGVRIIRADAWRPWLRTQDVLLGRLRKARSSTSSGQGALRPATAKTDGPTSPTLLARAARMKDVFDAMLAIPDRETGWLLPALLHGLRNQLGSERPDVIYSSAPPWTGQLVAAGLHYALRCPWVADFRDPWARAPWRGDRYPFAIQAAERLERFVVKRADRIVFVAAANGDDFAQHYGAAAATRFSVVRNGCDPAEFDALRSSLSPDPNGPFVLLHAGSLYAGRTPVPLLWAIARAIDEGRLDPATFRLRFLGSNSLKGTDLPTLCRQLGLEHVVEFLPRVPREQSIKAMMSASGLLLLQPGHAVSVPGKAYEYLAAGRPIFAIAAPGETANLARSSPDGIAVTTDDEVTIADALVDFTKRRLSGNAVLRRELFDGNIGAAEIADILTNVVRSHNASAQNEQPNEAQTQANAEPRVATGKLP